MFQEFRSAGEKLFLSGVNDTHSGNMSFRDGEKIFITAKNAMLSSLKEGDIIKVGLEEEYSTDSSASGDLLIHRLIYKITKSGAIIHAHPPNALALCVTENRILPQDFKGQSLFPSGVGIIKTKLGASIDEISQQVASALSEAKKLASKVKKELHLNDEESLKLAHELMANSEKASKEVLGAAGRYFEAALIKSGAASKGELKTAKKFLQKRVKKVRDTMESKVKKKWSGLKRK